MQTSNRCNSHIPWKYWPRDKCTHIERPQHSRTKENRREFYCWMANLESNGLTDRYPMLYNAFEELWKFSFLWTETIHFIAGTNIFVFQICVFRLVTRPPKTVLLPQNINSYDENSIWINQWTKFFIKRKIL